MKLLLPRSQKTLIGVVHLRPLPGSPQWSGNMADVIKRAVADALAYEKGGADAVVVENFGDVPFTKSAVPPETIAAMAAAGSAVQGAIKLPLGFNVLRNDARAALALCAACAGTFIRVNVHTGAMLTDQGIIEGEAFSTLRERGRLAPDVKIFADVQVKHAAPLAPMPLEDSAKDTLQRGLADALIVTGSGTGVATNLDDAKRLREACPDAQIFIGSGVNTNNVGELLRFADGVIVGSSLKRGGKLNNAVDVKRVEALRKAMHAAN